MTASKGLRHVLELIAPSVRASNAGGAFTPSNYASPLSVAAYALDSEFLVAVTATSTEAELLRDSVAALLGPDDEVALWPGWDTHPLERVSPDSQTMATRALLRWRIAQGRAARLRQPGGGGGDEASARRAKAGVRRSEARVRPAGPQGGGRRRRRGRRQGRVDGVLRLRHEAADVAAETSRAATRGPSSSAARGRAKARFDRDKR